MGLRSPLCLSGVFASGRITSWGPLVPVPFEQPNAIVVDAAGKALNKPGKRSCSPECSFRALPRHL